MRAHRLATLAHVRESYPLVQIDGALASSFARLAAEQLGVGGKVRGHDTWIAATALHLGVPVLNQDDDFTRFDSVEVIVL